MADDQTSSQGTGDDAAVRIQELEAQVAKLTDIAARAQADLQNAKVRLEKDADDSRKYAAQSVLIRLLPVIDNFQRAFQHLPDDLKDHNWIKGIAAIEQDFMRQLSDMGLKKFESLGEMADTARHEILTLGPGEEGIITEVFEEGYELNGRVLRPAKVKVGDGNGTK